MLKEIGKQARVDIEALLGCPVDIIRKHQHLNPFLLKEVEREGIEVIAER